MASFMVAVMDCDTSVGYIIVKTQRLLTITCQSKTDGGKNALRDAQEGNESVRHVVSGRFRSKRLLYITLLSVEIRRSDESKGWNWAFGDLEIWRFGRDFWVKKEENENKERRKKNRADQLRNMIQRLKDEREVNKTEDDLIAERPIL